MRNFSKTLISMAAVMAVGSAMAAGAMAGELTDINYADGKVTFGGVTTVDKEGQPLTQYTLLVVAKDGNGEFVATEETIKQIDQDDNGEAFAEAVVGELEKGEYKIMVGNNIGEVDSGILTVGSKVEPEVIYIGDVDGKDKVTATDAGYVFTYARNRKTKGTNPNEPKKYTANVANERTLFSDGTTKYYIGDVDGKDKVTATDAGYIFTYARNRKTKGTNPNEPKKYTANVANTEDLLPAN